MLILAKILPADEYYVKKGKNLDGVNQAS